MSVVTLAFDFHKCVQSRKWRRKWPRLAKKLPAPLDESRARHARAVPQRSFDKTIFFIIFAARARHFAGRRPTREDKPITPQCGTGQASSQRAFRVTDATFGAPKRNECSGRFET
jgi:hypothetical protein